MKIGVTLPQFVGDPRRTLDAARRVEAIGLDGAFVFDHNWPIGRPDRPGLAAFPLLGAVCAVTRQVCVGPLVARVGLVDDAVLVAQLRSLAAMSGGTGGRLVAGLGAGDAKSAAENDAYGIPAAPAAARRRSLESCARALMADGICVWVGGSAPETVAVARRLALPLNLWQVSPARLAQEAATGPTTWAGIGLEPGDGAGRAGPGGGGPGPSAGPTAPADGRVARAVVAEAPPGRAPVTVDDLAAAGATWAVTAWPGDAGLEALAAAASGARARCGKM